MERVKIIQLPSSYWSVWVDGDWMDASSRTEDEAEKKAAKLVKEYTA